MDRFAREQRGTSSGRRVLAGSLSCGRVLLFFVFLAATATVATACSPADSTGKTAVPVVDAPAKNAAEVETEETVTDSASPATERSSREPETGDAATGPVSAATEGSSEEAETGDAVTDSGSSGRRKFADGAGVGDAAPDFTLPTLRGEDVSLSEFRGSPVIIYFFTRLCGSHTFDLRFLQTAAASEAGNLPEVLVVGLQEDTRSLGWLVNRSIGDDYDFTVAADSSLTTFLQYQVLTVPVTFFVDGEGNIQSLHQGFLNEEFLATGVRGIQ